MKYVLKWLAIIIIGLLVLIVLNLPEVDKSVPTASQTSQSAIKAEKDNLPREEMKKLFQGGIEPTAKDAMWTADDILKIGVIDNGSPRDGYAIYVCEVLNEHGFKGHKVWVQIVDIVKIKRKNKWIKLGEAHCE